MTRRRYSQPVVLPARGRLSFPDPRDFDREGLLAVGGDLSAERLLLAYRSGIFPWYAEGLPPMWWSPDPRAVFDPDGLHVSRSLARVLRRGDFELRWNTAFRNVMRACCEGREDGTWILPEMIEAYARLHAAGHAHSLEVWRGAELVGGAYGVQVGGLFAAESMFHRRTDMSKVAVVALVRSLFAAGIELLDVQMPTDHLRSLGCRTLPRRDYLALLPAATTRVVALADLQPRL